MTVVPGRSLEAARRFVPDVSALERPITVDQTNCSVVVGEQVIVKWLQPPVPDPHPGVVVLRHLAAVGFDEMPGLLGVIAEGGHTVATVSRFVPGALDGWDWYVDEVTECLEQGDTAPVLRWADRIGALGGRLAVALTTPSTVVAAPTASVSAEALRRDLDLLLDDALALVPEQVLTDRAEAIRGEFAEVATLGTLRSQLLHGDLHVGQILRAGDTIVVTDFDGDPLAQPTLVKRFGPVERDLASLVQSVDHVMRVVARRRPEWNDALDELARVASVTTRDAFCQAPGIVIQPRLVRPLRIAQELHEYVYAVRHLPHWRYIPDSSLPPLVP